MQHLESTGFLAAACLKRWTAWSGIQTADGFDSHMGNGLKRWTAGSGIQTFHFCKIAMLQIKASLNHGEWLPWLNGEIEAGRLEVKRSQANTYMRVASNYQRAGNLEGVTSIRAALELLNRTLDPDAVRWLPRARG